ncbi:hypothetical protein [Bifidobacterium sp. ESL0745]|uniref:hypothetical protein n=1 Tax=Bifidobacterium sp. ESL0745 TaxID=2983226 RepID=UPI0023F9C02D|nr:hypothetical protein [Bifidobacterium sp. ESL0745]MDF7666035.1 hypothetical protein [Bifidobacterium sp. ESL0745]
MRWHLSYTWARTESPDAAVVDYHSSETIDSYTISAFNYDSLTCPHAGTAEVQIQVFVQIDLKESHKWAQIIRNKYAREAENHSSASTERAENFRNNPADGEWRRPVLPQTH